MCDDALCTVFELGLLTRVALPWTRGPRGTLHDTHLPRVVEGVHEAEGSRTGQTSRCHVDGEKLSEFGLGVGPGEHRLDRVLESEVKGLRGEVPDDVGHVPAPERLEPLLAVDAREAVPDPRVAGDLPGLDAWVGILSLDDELNALDRCRARLCDGTADPPEGKIHQEVRLRLRVSHLEEKEASEI